MDSFGSLVFKTMVVLRMLFLTFTEEDTLFKSMEMGIVRDLNGPLFQLFLPVL